MHRDRIVDLGTHALVLERILQVVPAPAPDHVLVEDVPVSNGFRQQHLRRAVIRGMPGINNLKAAGGEERIVTFCVLLPRLSPTIQVLQFDQHHRRLDCVQPKVSADNLMIVFRF